MSPQKYIYDFSRLRLTLFAGDGILVDVAADRRTTKDLRNRITSRFLNFDREVEEGNKEHQWVTNTT